MRDYAELVKELRYCGDRNNLDCKGCSRKPSPICDDGLKQDAADAIEELLARDVVPTDFHERCLQLEIRKRIELEKQMPQWISVEERLPEVGIDVLVTDGSDVCISHQVRYVSPTERFTFWSRDDLDLTHWMPLPSAPKEVE